MLNLSAVIVKSCKHSCLLFCCDRLVAKIVSGAVARLQIQTVVTFDDYGVSGHPNHIAASHGCRLWAQNAWKAGARPVITATRRRQRADFGTGNSGPYNMNRVAVVTRTDGSDLLAMAESYAQKMFERQRTAVQKMKDGDQPHGGAADGSDGTAFRLFTLESTSVVRLHHIWIGFRIV